MSSRIYILALPLTVIIQTKPETKFNKASLIKKIKIKIKNTTTKPQKQTTNHKYSILL